MIKFFVVVGLLLSSSLSMAADLNDALSNAYSIESGSPAGYQIGDRTVHTGGYIRIRIPVAEAPKLVSIEGPTMKGGCNGFDIYGGSFSMISADEIVNWLERVTDNSGALLTFTFMTYLKDQCSVCSDSMEWLYALQDLMNGSMASSCEAAGMVVGGLSTAISTKGKEFGSPEWDAYSSKQTEAVTRLGKASGAVADSADAMTKKAAAFFNNSDKKDMAADGYEDGGDSAPVAKIKSDKAFGGNLSFWLAFEGNLAKHISNVVGVNPSVDDLVLPLTFATLGSLNYVTKDSSVNAYAETIRPWIDFKTLYNYEENTSKINRLAKVFCPGYSSTESKGACQEPTNLQFRMKDFMGDFVKNMEGTPGGSKGIVAKLGQIDDQVNNAPTAAEQQFMNTLPNGATLINSLLIVSKYDSGSARELYETYKVKVQMQYLYAWFEALFDGYSKAASEVMWSDDTDHFGKALTKLISDRREVNRKQYQDLFDEHGVTNKELTEAFNEAIEAAKTKAGIEK